MKSKLQVELEDAGDRVLELLEPMPVTQKLYVVTMLQAVLAAHSGIDLEVLILAARKQHAASCQQLAGRRDADDT